MDKEKVLVAISGGIDSAVAAISLIQQGYNVIGCILKMHEFSQSSIADAEKICQQLNIELVVKDIVNEFSQIVKKYFYEEYLKGRTPNPCVLCNKELKWDSLINVADELNIYRIATGHYARTRFNPESNRYLISRSNYIQKDQTYMLWKLPQEFIRRTIFPIGEFGNKEAVRQFAKLNDIDIYDKGDSQDVCFIINDYRDFLREYSAGTVHQIIEEIGQGDIILDGKVIGHHIGYPYYTVGQRRGLGVAYKEPIYVKKINAENNTIEVATVDKMFSYSLVATDINFIKYDTLSTAKDFLVKIRYKDKGRLANCSVMDNNELLVNFYEPCSSIAIGQSVVLYDGDDLVGGGIIESVLD